MGYIKSGETQLTTEDFFLRASKAASVIEGFGVKKGDGVAVYLRNEIAFFEAVMGTGMLGAYAIPVNWHYTADEAAYLFNDADVKLIVIHQEFVPAIAGVFPEGVPVVVVETPTEISTAYNVSPQQGAQDYPIWRELMAGAEPRASEPETAPNSVIYTSGTTGRPKGVKREAFDPEMLASVTAQMCNSFGFGEIISGDRAPSSITTAVVGPLYHAAPNAHAVVSVRLGVNLVVLPRFDPEQLLSLIESQKITHLSMVPIMFSRLLKLPDEVRQRYDLSSLEYVTHAAAPCPAPVKRAMIDWWGPVIYEFYGSTEMGSVTCISSQDWLEHPGSVGRPMPGAEVRIIDDDGNDVPVGTVGEIIGLAVPGLKFAYQNAAKKTAEAARHGLVSPGDVGYFDEDGYLYICDRKIDMIISGGANIYPAEIEAELHKLPSVADCAVFGIPDEEFGESVMAVVQPVVGANPTERELQADLRKAVSGYKVPRRIEFSDELPREDSGKIFKRKLRAPFWEGHERSI